MQVRKNLNQVVRAGLNSLTAAVLALAPETTVTARAEVPQGLYARVQDNGQKQKKEEIPVVTDVREKEIRKPYESDRSYKSKDPAFFDALYKDALDPKNDSAIKWVLLNLAGEYAENTSNIDGAFRVIDTMDELYESIRPVARKCGVLEKARKKIKSPEQTEAMVYHDFSLSEIAMKKGDFTTAKDLAENAKKDAIAAKNRPLEQRATSLLNDLNDLQKEYIVIVSKETDTALEKGDAEANQAVGWYLYFVNKDQKQAATYLSKAKDPLLQKIGNLESLLPDNPASEALKELGDLWYDASKSTKTQLNKRRAQTAAYTRYKAAYSSATAPSRRMLDSDKEFQKRMKELALTQPPGIPTNLLPLLDLANAKGAWEYKNGILSSSEADHQYIQSKFVPNSLEYELNVQVKLKSGIDPLQFGLPVGDRNVHVRLDPGASRISYLELEGGKKFEYADSAKIVPSMFAKSAQRTVKCVVGSSRFQVFVDDKMTIDWNPADYSQASKGGLFNAPNPKVITIGSSSEYEITKALVTPK